ncbi:MAG: ubiquinol-cytochrome C chaperone family protein [Magnetococcales bacterium]|nr:ubiquinol-cytochrome C chaperone family protein [Magnetococcales bacterium]
MFSWLRTMLDKWQDRTLRPRVVAEHGALVERALDWSGAGWLELEDRFDLRFEVLILLVSVRLHDLRHGIPAPDGREGLPPDAEERLMRLLWEITFEGFDHTLRQQGVPDLRMGARMRKLFHHATGRRDAYLAALEGSDAPRLRAAIGRNVLDGAAGNDPRVTRIMALLYKEFPNSIPEEAEQAP